MRFSFKPVFLVLGLFPFTNWPTTSNAAPQATPKITKAPSPVPLVAGQKAPSLSLVDASKRLRRLADLRGKRHLLITFFPKCFTGNCTSQLTSLRDSYPDLQKQGVEVWAVSTDAADGPRGQRAFSQHLKLPFPLIPDTDRKISFTFGAVQSKEQMAARMSVLIDKDGTVRWIDKQMNPRTHGADVLARLQQQGAGQRRKQ